MGADEAIDLIRALPDGSRWVAATYPLRAWGEERVRDADILDAVNRVAWSIGVWDRTFVPEPPTVTRPADRMAREQAARAARAARIAVESGGWEEM